jgi:hypothetical protein
VLTWLAVALGTGAAVVAIGWAVRRTDELGRPRRFPWVTVALLLALGAGAAVPGVLRASQERRLGTAASVLAGARVAVRCARASAGPSSTPAPSSATCAGGPTGPGAVDPDQARPVPPPGRLRALGRRRPTRDQVVAVHVLTHEAMHLSGRLAEAVAECAAVQRDAQTARLLGARPADAAELAAAYWRNIYPLMPDSYRSADCRPGGAMDERLPDAPWLSSMAL